MLQFKKKKTSTIITSCKMFLHYNVPARAASVRTSFVKFVTLFAMLERFNQDDIL